MCRRLWWVFADMSYTDDTDHVKRKHPVNVIPGAAPVYNVADNLLELEARITRLEKWTALPDTQQRSSSCDGPL